MVTQVVVIRHGKPLTGGYAEDALKPLSEEGKTTQKAVTQRLKQDGIAPTTILCSPLLRAQQTAEVIADIFDIPFKSEVALGIDFDSDRLLALIPPPERDETLFLIGHAPTLTDFVHLLVGQEVLAEGMAKSSAAVIDFHKEVAPGSGKFINYYLP